MILLKAGWVSRLSAYQLQYLSTVRVYHGEIFPLVPRWNQTDVLQIALKRNARI